MDEMFIFSNELRTDKSVVETFSCHYGAFCAFMILGTPAWKPLGIVCEEDMVKIQKLIKENHK